MHRLTRKKKLRRDILVIDPLFQFREDRVISFKAMTNNTLTNQVPAAPLNMHKQKKNPKKLKQNFMERSLLFQYCEDQISCFEAMANNFSINQVPAV